MKREHSASQTIDLKVAGMDCPDEIRELTRAFKGQAGILDLSFNLMRGTLTVSFDPSATDSEHIISIVQTWVRSFLCPSAQTRHDRCLWIEDSAGGVGVVLHADPPHRFRST